MDVLTQYLSLCWLQSNPLKLPRSVSFLKQNLLFYFVVEFFMQTNMTDDPIDSFIEVTIATLLMLLFIGGLLFLNRMLFAYIQVMTAVIFCTNVVGLFIVPVVVWLTVSEDILSYYLFTVLLLWNGVLVAYIFKQVLAVNIAAGLVLSLFYFVTTYFGAFGLGQLL